MNTTFRTCRGCGLKDATTSWRADAHRVLCITCHLDAKAAADAAARADESALVTFSPAAFAAMTRSL